MYILKWFKPSTSKYSTHTIFKWLWIAWRGNRLQALLNASIGLLLVGVSLAQVWAVQRAIDTAAGIHQGSIYEAVMLIAVFILSGFGLNIASIWIKNILGIKAQNRMQQKMLDRILRSEWAGKEDRHSGDVLNRLEIDVKTVVSFLTETLPSTLSTLFMFLGAFFYLFSMDKALSFIIVAIIPVFILLSKLYIRQMRKLTKEVREQDSKVQSVLQETIQHKMLIKSMESDDMMVDRLRTTQSQLRHKVIQRTRFSVISSLILNIGFAFGYLTAFLWAALRLADKTLTFGGMTAFLQLVNKIQEPARALTNLAPAFVAVFTAAERLMELEDNPLEEQGDGIALTAPCGIRLDNVEYTYQGSEQAVISQLNFDFKPASCTAILGETGAGKTTLIRLLLAFLHPQQGNITLYNKQETINASALTRCNFVYVPQGNTLMSGTIRENLRLGKVDATEDEMIEALNRSCAQFVFDLPNGIDSVCGEQGTGLSEGQAQRISIARALLRSGSVMLFDEATSALDMETEQQLLQNILEKQDKTVIFITHRQAVINYCDHVLTIHAYNKPQQQDK